MSEEGVSASHVAGSQVTAQSPLIAICKLISEPNDMCNAYENTMKNVEPRLDDRIAMSVPS
jgi:hypothetical protein